ncbi:hypothetical protein BDZ90DRAFT_2488 [Jaminaea rosea]|uniref:Uncharacterized protein n=1 Tax=Jaminaea rosea TaxID=1569628 RepID=A0A316UYW6_9BASI|nr:hypothetical protein BDZ90DRAFT_2488 [Jaminaea rosea]PWN29988.1 hypothetical protein BDZ90DRAFT_2488 [Jaminaea rosea]
MRTGLLAHCLRAAPFCGRSPGCSFGICSIVGRRASSACSCVIGLVPSACERLAMATSEGHKETVPLPLSVSPFILNLAALTTMFHSLLALLSLTLSLASLIEGAHFTCSWQPDKGSPKEYGFEHVSDQNASDQASTSCPSRNRSVSLIGPGPHCANSTAQPTARCWTRAKGRGPTSVPSQDLLCRRLPWLIITWWRPTRSSSPRPAAWADGSPIPWGTAPRTVPSLLSASTPRTPRIATLWVTRMIVSMAKGPCWHASCQADHAYRGVLSCVLCIRAQASGPESSMQLLCPSRSMFGSRSEREGWILGEG